MFDTQLSCRSETNEQHFSCKSASHFAKRRLTENPTERTTYNGFVRSFPCCRGSRLPTPVSTRARSETAAAARRLFVEEKKFTTALWPFRGCMYYTPKERDHLLDAAPRNYPPPVLYPRALVGCPDCVLHRRPPPSCPSSLSCLFVAWFMFLRGACIPLHVMDTRLPVGYPFVTSEGIYVSVRPFARSPAIPYIRLFLRPFVCPSRFSVLPTECV